MSNVKPYTLQKSSTGYMFVMPKDYRGMNYILPFVSKELKEKSYSGMIIFDLLLSNGDNKSRYFQIYFDGQKILKDTIQKLFPAPAEYHSLSNKFLKRNPEVLGKGILTARDIEHIKQLL